MKKRTIAIISVVAMLIMAFSVSGAFASDKGPASVNLDFNGKSKHVNNFPHHDHQAKVGDCKTCHHKSDGTTHKACKTCHHDKKGDAPAMKDAMHERCKGCHKKGKKGPTKCNDCHNR